MKTSFLLAVGLLLAFPTWPALPAPAPAADDPAVERYLDLLQVQMKLRVLSYLRDTNFFVPRTLLQQYLEEQDKLNADLAEKARLEVDAAESWVAEDKKVRKAEKDTLEKLAEDWGRKVLAKLVSVKDGPYEIKEGDPDSPKLKFENPLDVWRGYQLELNQWKLKRERSALPIALYVEGVLRLQVKGNGPPLVRPDQAAAWGLGARKTYRGAMRESDRLVQGIGRLEAERISLEGSVKAMKDIEKALSAVEFLRSDPVSVKGALDLTKEQLVKYLEKNYAGDDPITKQNIKTATDKGFKLLEKGIEAWTSLAELDKNPAMQANPSALQTCKRVAVFSAMFDGLLTLSADAEALKGVGPLASVLDYYVKALALVPKFATAMQGFVTAVDQGSADARALSTFGQMPAELGPFWDTALMRHFGVQLATGHDTREGQAAAEYVLAVPVSMDKRGWIPLTPEQYDRLAQAVADERVLFAFEKRASRSFFAGLPELLDFSKAAVTDSPWYRVDLGAQGRQTPFKVEELLKLARGEPIDFKPGWLSTARKLSPGLLRRDAENALDTLALEGTVRRAVSDYDKASLARWSEFRALIWQQQLALPPDRLLKLFSVYNAKPERARASLLALAARREQERKGVARVGIPLVCPEPRVDPIQPGSTVRVVAHAVVSDLAPGREITARAHWKLPAWAGGGREQQVTLRNGPVKIACEMAVPANAPPGTAETSLILRVPLEPGELEVAGSGQLTLGGELEPTAPLTPSGTGPTLPQVGMSPGTGPARPGTLEPATPPPSTNAAGPATSALPPSPLDSSGSGPSSSAGSDLRGVVREGGREFTGRGSFEVQPRGRLSLASRRAEGFEANVVEVTSADLPTLDRTSSDTGLVFTLYEGDAPEGPFAAAGAVLWVFGGPVSPPYERIAAKPLQPGARGSGLLGRDRLQLTHPLQAAGRRESPLYYRVGQRPFTRATMNNPLPDSEIQSPVWGPGARAFIMISSSSGDRPAAGSSLPAQKSASPRYGLGMKLCLEEQWFTFPGAHFVVQAGDWTGQVWATPPAWIGNLGSAYLEFPDRARGQQLTITGTADDFEATATLTIAPDPDRAAKGEETARQTAAWAELEAKNVQRQLERVRGELAQQERPSGVALAPVWEIGGQLKIMQLKQEIERLTKAALPRVEAEGRRRAAEARQDWRGLLEAELDLRRLADTERDLVVRYDSALEPLRQKIRSFGDRAAERELDVRAPADQALSRKRELDSLEFGRSEALTEAAFQAGNGAAYLGGLLRQARRLAADSRKGLGDCLCSAADRLSILTGWREEAVPLLLLGRALRLETATENEAARWKESFRSAAALPNWWPEGQPPMMPPAAFSMEALEQAVDSLRPTTPRGSPAVRGGTRTNPLGTVNVGPTTPAPGGDLTLLTTEAAGWLRAGRFSDAEATYRRLVEAEPGRAAHQQGLGEALFRQQKWAQAEPVFREAVRLNPAAGENQAYLGGVCWAQKKWAEAEAAYREAIRLQPADGPSHFGLGCTLSQVGKLAEATEELRQDTRLRPQNAASHFELGNLLQLQGKWADAETPLREAIRLDATDGRFHQGLGLTLLNLRKYEEAEVAFRQDTRLRPQQARSFYELGNALLWQKKAADAEVALKEAARLEPGNADHLAQLGTAFWWQNRWPEAEKAYRQAIALQNNRGDFHANLAGALLRQGRSAEARQAAQQALRLGCKEHWVFKDLGLAP